MLNQVTLNPSFKLLHIFFFLTGRGDPPGLFPQSRPADIMWWCEAQVVVCCHGDLYSLQLIVNFMTFKTDKFIQCVVSSSVFLSLLVSSCVFLCFGADKFKGPALTAQQKHWCLRILRFFWWVVFWIWSLALKAESAGEVSQLCEPFFTFLFILHFPGSTAAPCPLSSPASE